MKRLAFILAALLCGSAYADLIARNGANEIRLQEGTCANEGILSQIKNDYRDQFKSGAARFNGQNFSACWFAMDGQVFIIFDDGDRVVLPQATFGISPGA